MDNNINILATRKIDSALRDAAWDRGFHIDCLSFITTSPLAGSFIASAIGNFSRQQLLTVFTSVAAVHATFQYVDITPDWRAFTISGATKACLCDYLGADAILGDAINADQLSQVIQAQAPAGKLVFFCGDKRSQVLPDTFSKMQLSWEELVVYTTTLTPQALSRAYDAYLFFSPSAVQSFFQLHAVPAESPAVAIGTSTAAALRQLGVAIVLVADFPDQEHVLETLYAFYKQ